MNSKSNFQVLAVSVGKILSMLATFVMPIILVRVFSKPDYGMYNQFNAVFLFLAALFSLGFKSNLFYFYPTVPNSQKRSVLFQTIFVLFLMSLVASVFVLYDGVNHLLLGKGDLVKYKLYIALAIVFFMVSGVSQSIYVLRRDLKISLVYPLIGVLIKVVFVVALVLYYKTLEAALLGVIFSFLVLFIFTLFYANYELKKYVATSYLNMSVLKKQFKYALPFGLSTSLRAITTKVDKILAISFLSASSYASYSVAFFAIPGVQAIYDSLVQVYVIEMTKEFKNQNSNKVIAIYHDLVSKSYSYTIPIVVTVFFHADVIIETLFTSVYTDSIVLFRIYLFSILFLVLGAGIVIRSSGKTRYTLKAYIISAFITLPSTYFLIANKGVFGAVISALIAVIMPALLLLNFDIKILKTNLLSFFPWSNISKITGISVVCFLPIALFHFFYEKTIVTMIFNSVIYLSSVFIWEYRLKIFIIEQNDFEVIVNKIRGLFK